MKKISKYFKNKPEFYVNDVDPIRHYLEIGNYFLKTMKDSTLDYKDKIKTFIKEIKSFKDPTVYFYERDINGKKNKSKTSLSSYIKYVKDTGDIIVPSFTVYFSKDKKASLHADFIGNNIKERSKHKKLAFKYKMNKQFEQFEYHNTIQKVKKIFNNSLSGAYASAGTVLNNPSAHYTLTSITRCVSGIGNALSESIISGNKHYKDPDVTLEHLVTIAYSTPTEEVERVIHKYNIHIPTADEVMASVIKSSSKYWRNLEKERIIFDFLNRIDGFKRAFILYSNDMYHFRTYNPDLMRGVIAEATTKVLITKTEEEYDDILNLTDEWIYNTAALMCISDLRGKKRDDFTLVDKRNMASAIIGFTNTIDKYGDIFKLFLVTNIFPVSITDIKDMVREAIVLSDTDSTCSSYGSWVDWYFNKPTFSDNGLAVSSVIIALVTQSMDHYIKLFAGNMNVKYEDAQSLEMKNEFVWDVFVNTNVSKHYFANVVSQEGNIYAIDLKKSLERKGVNLIAPNAYQPIRDMAEEMMIDIMNTTFKKETVPLTKYLNKVLEAEEIIKDLVYKGSPDVLKLEKIKDAKGYKKGELESPYTHYILWNKVFKPLYGDAPKPTFMAVKFPTTINSKNDMNIFLDSCDEEFRNNFKDYLTLSGKSEIKVFRLPLIVTHTKGIPKELLPIISTDRVIIDNCRVLYMVLETLGFFIKPDETLTNMLK